MWYVFLYIPTWFAAQVSVNNLAVLERFWRGISQVVCNRFYFWRDVPHWWKYWCSTKKQVKCCCLDVDLQYAMLPYIEAVINTLWLRQNGYHFTDDTFKCISVNENVRVAIKISLKFVLQVPINNIPALVQMMAWHRPGDKPLSDPLVVSLLMRILVIQQCWGISRLW